MRRREKRLVLSFSSTTQAMRAERCFLEQGIPGRLIPLPGEISADCGLAWNGEIKDREQIKRLEAEGKIAVEEMRELYLYAL